MLRETLLKTLQNFCLCHQVAFACRSRLHGAPPSHVLVEINEYGVRMSDAREGQKKAENWEKLSAKQRLVHALQQVGGRGGRGEIGWEGSAGWDRWVRWARWDWVGGCGWWERSE